MLLFGAKLILLSFDLIQFFKNFDKLSNTTEGRPSFFDHLITNLSIALHKFEKYFLGLT